MGADLILYSVIMFGKYNPNFTLEDRKRRMATEMEHIDKTDEEEYRNNITKELGYTWDETDEYKDLMIDAINDFFDSLDNRDVTWRIIGNCTLWITGGMSYGDEPSESYTIFEEFAMLPNRILTAGGFEGYDE